MEEVKEYIHYYENRDELNDDYSLVEKIMPFIENSNYDDSLQSLTLFGKWYIFSGYDATNEGYVWVNEDNDSLVATINRNPMPGDLCYTYGGGQNININTSFVVNRKLTDKYYEPWVSMNVKEKYIDVDLVGAGIPDRTGGNENNSVTKTYYYDDCGFTLISGGGPK